MAQVGYMLCSKAADNTLTALGVWKIEQEARDAATDGDYVLIPVNEGEKYPNIVDLTMPGAIQFTVSGVNTRLDALEQEQQNQAADITANTDEIATINTKINNAAGRLGTAENDIDALEVTTADHEARITALEP